MSATTLFQDPVLLELADALSKLLYFGAFMLALTMILERFQLRASLRKQLPPPNGRFLILLLMRGKDGDALLRDLDERFLDIANDKTQGLARAHFWYWFQVFVSIWPFIPQVLKRITGLAALYDAIRRIIP